MNEPRFVEVRRLMYKSDRWLWMVMFGSQVWKAGVATNYIAADMAARVAYDDLNKAYPLPAVTQADKAATDEPRFDFDAMERATGGDDQ